MTDMRLRMKWRRSDLRCSWLFIQWVLSLMLMVLVPRVPAQEPVQKEPRQQNSGEETNEQVYVNPVVWPGVLILQSGLQAGELASRNRGSVSFDIQLSAAEFVSQLAAVGAVGTWSQSRSISVDVDREAAEAIARLDAESHAKFIQCWQSVLENGGTVRFAGELGWLGESPDKRLALLPNCLICADENAESFGDSLLQVCIPPGAVCQLSKRLLTSLSEQEVLRVRLPGTDNYVEALTQELKKPRASMDWVQWQRARLERQRPRFPGAERVEHALPNGSLVIGGGGGMPAAVWQRFVELAGGEQARIVILPTAVEDPSGEPGFEDRVMRQAGAKHIVTLAEISRSEVEDVAFLAELDRATGVWFGGGRQWRFVDAYWGTEAWQRLLRVCERGGVIGGSSAGATIQGDLLVRGAPAGNHIMIADGYRRGLALLPWVAIDQHFFQRNRFAELEGCLADYPAIFGVGIDEQTALVVTAPNHCEVLGSGSVWLYPSYEVGDALKADSATRAGLRQQFRAGSSFSF